MCGAPETAAGSINVNEMQNVALLVNNLRWRQEEMDAVFFFNSQTKATELIKFVFNQSEQVIKKQRNKERERGRGGVRGGGALL